MILTIAVSDFENINIVIFSFERRLDVVSFLFFKIDLLKLKKKMLKCFRRWIIILLWASLSFYSGQVYRSTLGKYIFLLWARLPMLKSLL